MLRHGTAKTCGQHMLFQSDNRCLVQLFKHFLIQRLDGGGVHHHGADMIRFQNFRSFQRCRHHGSYSQQHTIRPVQQDLPPAGHEGSQRILLHQDGLPGITDRARGLYCARPLHHQAQFLLIPWSQKRYIRHMAKVSDVIDAMVGSAILPRQPRPVQKKAYGQVLQTDIMQHLVIPALQKSGIHRKIWPHAAGGQACRLCYGMLLSNTHIQHSCGESIRKQVHPRAAGHGGGENDRLFLLGGRTYQFLRGNFTVGGAAGLLSHFSAVQKKRRCAMKRFRLLFRLMVSITFAGDAMDQYRLVKLLGTGNGVLQVLQVVAVDWSQDNESPAPQKSLHPLPAL